MESSAPRPTGPKLTSQQVRRLRADQDAKIASFEQLGGVDAHTVEVLDLIDEQVQAEWRISRRSARAGRLAAASAALAPFRGGGE